MKVLGQSVILVLSVFLIGCSSNGKHVYVDGKCISCWNNPITNETLDYQAIGANNYKELVWGDMMLEGLSRNKVQNVSLYGEDYLIHKVGLKYVSLKNNEISYQRLQMKSADELKSALQKHKLKEAYQSTFSSRIGDYDFSKQAFPVMLAKKLSLKSFKGGNKIKVLPTEIDINIENFSALPSLKMSPKNAEFFLKNGGSGRGLYVRYIVEITDMITPSSFNARVREIQFIDVKPSSFTQLNKEKHQPFRAIKIQLEK